MGKPKTSTTSRRSGNRRSQHVVKLARKVNGLIDRNPEAQSSVKAYTTSRESSKKISQSA